MSLRLHRWLGQRVARDLFTRPPGSLPALDGIRGFACAAIVFFHATVFSGVFLVRDPDPELRALRFLGNAMWTGVDIFFVLSGFLIARILIRDLLRSGHVGWRRFYLRRSFRIFPAYYFVLSVILFVLARFDLANYGSYLAFTGAGSWESVRDGAWANYLYLSNYVAPTRVNVMTWGWSLCVEEHFYLLLPTALALIFRVRREALRAGLLVALAGLPVAARALAYATASDRSFYYFSHTRFDQLLVGVVVAYLYVVYREPFERLARRHALAIGALGIACIGAVWTWGGLRGAGVFAVVWQFFVLGVGVALVVVNGIFGVGPLSRFFASPAWFPLARVSYGIYLVHPVVIFACIPWLKRVWIGAAPVGTPQVLVLYLCAMAVSFTLASLLFLLLERPLLDLGARLGGRASSRRPGSE